jgi:hypothetical protein
VGTATAKRPTQGQQPEGRHGLRLALERQRLQLLDGDGVAREVPRQLELATARAAGDTSVPAELVNYEARSAAGKRQRTQPRSPIA